MCISKFFKDFFNITYWYAFLSFSPGKFDTLNLCIKTSQINVPTPINNFFCQSILDLHTLYFETNFLPAEIFSDFRPMCFCLHASFYRNLVEDLDICPEILFSSAQSLFALLKVRTNKDQNFLFVFHYSHSAQQFQKSMKN